MTGVIQQYLHNAGFYSFLLILAGPFFLSMVDFFVLTRTRGRRYIHPHGGIEQVRDFTILVPIFGNLKYLKNIRFLKYYASRVILCTTTKETSKFNRGLEKIAKLYGFSIFRSDVRIASQSHPNPWNLFKGTLHNSQKGFLSDAARDEIIRDSFNIVTTSYCIFLDGDTVVKGNVNSVVGDMVKYGYDIASVRVLASRRRNLIERLQAVEYELAMDARKIYPWLTSGAGMIARTSVVKNIMAHHSLFFSGGDIEIGKLAMMLGYRVGYIGSVFLTDVPATFRDWLKQRIAWSGGSFRHSVVNLHIYAWQHPFFFLYTTVIVWFMTPLRWLEIIQRPVMLLFVVIMYWALIALFHWKKFRWYYILFPFYSLFQVMIVIPLGVYYYFKTLYHYENIGFIHLRTNPLKRLAYRFEDIGI